MEGPYDGDVPTRTIDYSIFRGLPDEAKGTWAVRNNTANIGSKPPSGEASDFMEANSATPAQLRDTEDRAAEAFRWFLSQGGVPE